MPYKTIECSTHGVTQHRLVAQGVKTPRWRCCLCYKSYHRKHRESVKEKIYAYKGKSCSRCGYNKCLSALEFHHLDPSQKDFGISEEITGRSWVSVKKELDKCILICSNCHREIHEEILVSGGVVTHATVNR